MKRITLQQCEPDNDAISCSGYRFPADVTSYAVWLYNRFPLSLRMVEELLAARGIELTYETVRRWSVKFGLGIARRIRALRDPGGDSRFSRACIEQQERTRLLVRAPPFAFHASEAVSQTANQRQLTVPSLSGRAKNIDGNHACIASEALITAEKMQISALRKQVRNARIHLMPLRVIARGEQGRTAAGKAGKAITVREDVAEACRQRWRHLVAPVDFVVVDSQKGARRDSRDACRWRSGSWLPGRTHSRCQARWRPPPDC